MNLISRRHSVTALSAIIFSGLSAVSFAQAPVAGTAVHATASPAGTHVSAQATVGVQPHAPHGYVQAPPPVHDDRLDNATLVQRGAVIGIGGAGAGYAATKIGGGVRSVANVGKVGKVPHWGPAAASVPYFGSKAAGGSLVPTTLGQVPVMGPVVKSVPGVGPVIAGPANPVVVGAVAIDNYVIPKYAPCGYTKSSIIAANNDFNAPPRLRSYVNYLAPMPYTHPPIFSPSTLKTDLPADIAYIDGIPSHSLNTTVSMPDL